MAWGTVTIGGLALREDVDARQAGDTLTMAGQEAHPPSTRVHVRTVQHNLSQLPGLTVPVTFTDKPELDGFYTAGDVSSDLYIFAGGSQMQATWQASLARVGSGGDVEVESRVPTVARLHEHGGAVAPVFWHAPAVGFDTYYTGAVVPSGAVTRDSTEGPVTVFTGIPAGVAPRWTAAPAEYLWGSARLLFDGVRRLGTVTPPLAVWEVNNGLLRVVAGGGGQIVVSCWSGGDWRSAKAYRFYAGADLGAQPDVTVLRNDPEEVTLRLTYPTSPGRTSVDLSLRRGSRFVTGVMKRHSAATLRVASAAAEAATAVTGGVRATAADADGNRYVIGSSRTVVTDLVTGSIEKAASLRFDFFVGHEVGVSPAAGDAYADLLNQYLGSAGERTRIVRR